jgi:dihydrofolate reductase
VAIIEVLQQDRSVAVMSQLIYFAVTSLDGYVEDQEGHIDWSAPEEELFSFITDLERPISTYLYGRGMYEAMLYWETAQPTPGQPGSFSSFSDFQSIWREAQKVVYSRTLESVSSARTRVERDFDAPSDRHLKDSSDHDMTVGGSTLAGQAIRLGLVDELRLFILPVILGGGKSWLPNGVRLDLELLDIRRFPHGSTYLSYRPVVSN